MTEYKKPAPENTSGCMTHSVGSGREPDIEWHLAEILNLVEMLKSWEEPYIYVPDIKEELDEIVDRVRKTWDLVPEPKSVMDHSQALRDKGKFHA